MEGCGGGKSSIMMRRGGEEGEGAGEGAQNPFVNHFMCRAAILFDSAPLPVTLCIRSAAGRHFRARGKLLLFLLPLTLLSMSLGLLQGISHKPAPPSFPPFLAPSPCFPPSSSSFRCFRLCLPCRPRLRGTRHKKEEPQALKLPILEYLFRTMDTPAIAETFISVFNRIHTDGLISRERVLVSL